MSPLRTFLDVLVARRSIYALTKASSISNSRIEEIIKTTLQNVPSAFNTQTTRVVLLLAGDHKRLWDITMETLFPIIQPSQRADTTAKLENFKNAHGTILFFEDKRALKARRDDAKYAVYHQHFESWSLQTSGMHQFAIWTALVTAGLGANLQHYNPLIDEMVRKEWSVDPNWDLIAQMPFGRPVGLPNARSGLPVEGRFVSFGKDGVD